jgi:hypothetical protein
MGLVVFAEADSDWQRLSCEREKYASYGTPETYARGQQSLLNQTF